MKDKICSTIRCWNGDREKLKAIAAHRFLNDGVTINMPELLHEALQVFFDKEEKKIKAR